jgi:hypothetical protein
MTASHPLSDATRDYVLALRWVWAARNQIDRFIAVKRREAVPIRPSLLAYVRDVDEGFADAHFLLVAAAHAGKRLAALSRDTRNQALALDASLVEDIKIWRDSWEHWDEQAPTFSDPTVSRHRAGLKLERKYGAEIHPGVISQDGTGLWVGKIELYGLRGELEKRDYLLRTLIAAAYQAHGETFD